MKKTNNEDFQKAVEYFSENPCEFVTSTIDFEPTTQQAKVLSVIPEAIRLNKSIAIKSGHGVGKTATAALLVLWYITVFPDARIICTAPSKGQLLDVLWPEISKWQQRFKFGEMFEWTKTRFYHKMFPETWFASARTANKPESMAGIHGEHVLIIMDEASGIEQDVYETMEGAETEEGALRILLSNPTKTTGEFYDAFHSKKDDYLTFTFSSLDSERVKKDYASKIARKYGKDSNVYRIRVLGEFPLHEDNTVIGIDTVERAHERYLDLDDKERQNIINNSFEFSLGIDVARYGDDEACIYSNFENRLIKKEVILKKCSTMSLAGQAVALRNGKYKDIKKCYFNVDLTGVGNGVVDRLIELRDEGILRSEDVINGISNNGSAMNKEEYGNIISELWFEFGNILKHEAGLESDDLEEDNNLQQQLCSRKYDFTSKGQRIIESKKVLKKRLNGTSPDRADAAILTIAHNLFSGEILISDPDDNKKNLSDTKVKEKVEDFQQTSIKNRLKFYKNSRNI